MTRVLFMSSEDYLPAKVGGAEWSTHYLCLALAARGVEVAVLARLGRGLRNRLLCRSSVLRRQVRSDAMLGYPVYRCRDPAAALTSVLERFRPSVVVAIAGFAFELAAAVSPGSVPVVLYLRDMARVQLPRGSYGYLANSRCVAERHAAALGFLPAVVEPLVPEAAYATGSGERNVVAFFNPRPSKGVELVFELAKRRRDIPFEFVETWPIPPGEWLALRLRARAGGNIRWHRPMLDVRRVYCRTRVLIVPSQWEEAWGRVVTEAHHSGIPVVASRCGGLVESVGEGGILVDPAAPAEEWERALARLWDDPVLYAAVSRAALLHSRRPEMATDALADRFLAAVTG